MNKKMNHEHPTLFRYFDILHTYLGLVNSCLTIKMMKKNSAKKQATAKKRSLQRISMNFIPKS